MFLRRAAHQDPKEKIFISKNILRSSIRDFLGVLVVKQFFVKGFAF
jgi:hypothetical protein